MSNKYHYHIVYAHSVLGALGSCGVTRESPITSHYDIIGISDVIARENGFTRVVVLNWILFDDPPLAN